MKFAINLFEDSVKIFPNHIAIADDQKQMTYYELNAIANQTARFLRNKGVKKGVFVCLSLDRSINAFICILSILKLGAIYIPFDKALPKPYRDKLIATLDSPYLIFSDYDYDLEISKNNIIYLEKIFNEISNYPNDDLQTNIHQDDLIYIIFTSGSTGIPKGVKMSQKAIAHYSQWFQNTNTGVKQKVLQISLLSFDMVFEEMLAAWIFGGCLRLVSESKKNMLDELAKFIIDEKIERVYLACNIFVELSSIFISQNLIPRQIQEITIFGDHFFLTPQLKTLIKQMNCKFTNLYGASEVQVVTTFRLQNFDYHKIPIGVPVDNTRVYILDSSLKHEVENGILCVASPMLFSGYLNNDILNNKTLIPNPFKKIEDPEYYNKIYVTGDLARRIEGNNIEFIGRNDSQVKIKGFRIDLSQVEKAIMNIQLVEQAIVIVKKNNLNRSILIGFIKSNSGVTDVMLRSILSENLPKYMIPSRFIILTQFPTTRTGKIDRKALLDLDVLTPERNNNQVIKEAYNYIEEKLCNIWREVLEVEVTNTNQNFFESGGDSLNVVSTILMIEKTFNISMSFKVFFDNPTISGLSKFIQTNKQYLRKIKDTSHQNISNITSNNLSHSQERILYLDQVLKKKFQLNIFNVLLLFKLKGNIELPCLVQSIETLIKRHDALRMSIILNAGLSCIQHVHNDCTIEIKEYDSSINSDEDSNKMLQHIARQQADYEFDLSKAPLFKISLVKTSNDNFYLFFNFHHLLVDERAINIIFTELSSLYNCFSKNISPNLEKLNVKYIDLIALQKNRFNKQLINKQTSYWSDCLNGYSLESKIFVDKKPQQKLSDSGYYAVEIYGEKYEAIKSYIKESNITISIFMLAVYAILISRYIKKRKVLVCSPILNRNFPNFENIVGCFTNITMFALEVDGGISFDELILKVKNTAISVYDNQEMPTSQLLQFLKTQPKAADQFFQFFFESNNTQKLNLSLDGIKSQIIDNIYPMDYLNTKKSPSIQVKIEYSKDHYFKKTIRNIMQDIQDIIDQGLKNSSIRIEKISCDMNASKISSNIYCSIDPDYYSKDEDVQLIMKINCLLKLSVNEFR